MDTLLTSTLTVFIAEMGDKTQLLSLVLVSRFKNRWAIVLGLTAATLPNHALSAWLGELVGGLFQGTSGKLLIGGSFIALAIWLTFPDKSEEVNRKYDALGAFLVATLLFFIAEIGDKTQVATLLLGARFNDLLLVTAGTTVGMLLANVPIIFAGNRLINKIPMKLARWLAAALSATVGLFYIFA